MRRDDVDGAEGLRQRAKSGRRVRPYGFLGGFVAARGALVQGGEVEDEQDQAVLAAVVGEGEFI